MAGWLSKPLQTENLILRPTRPGDEDWIIKLFTDADVRLYLGGAMSLKEANDFVKLTGEKWGHFAIVLQETDTVVGSLSFARKTGPWEISYQLMREYWGKNIAAEAIQAALLWFFNETAEDEVFAVTRAANKRSCRLLEKMGAKYHDSYEYNKVLLKQYIFDKSDFGI